MNIPDVTHCDSLAEATRIIMLAQEGVSEIGTTNTGPEVNEYLASVHLPGGYPWCSALLCWSIQQAAKQLNVTPEFKYGASAYKLWTTNQDLILTEPMPNCAVIKNEGVNSAGHAVGHVMFLLNVNDNGSLNVISGNTNLAGSREGTSVVIQNRGIDQLALGYGYLEIR
jgi:hypothetical protein